MDQHGLVDMAIAQRSSSGIDAQTVGLTYCPENTRTSLIDHRVRPRLAEKTCLSVPGPPDT